jgi:hypothetical protein
MTDGGSWFVSDTVPPFAIPYRASAQRTTLYAIHHQSPDPLGEEVHFNNTPRVYRKAFDVLLSA